MGTLSHFSNLYSQAFEGCKPAALVLLLKAYSVFCAIMIFMAVYALTDRALNGWDF
ncbi:DUF6747 family protein [Maribacter algarum]|uniref:DUF6747 family protein n=1 Tax=Maribacter algarum (ex Zhang et al. 2020) TaxID=2578118 RepID=UPI001487529A|nr:DUF6747 family protein [Maribacter algarum]